MLIVFDLHFKTITAVEAMSRICACKTERNLQIFGWCLQIKQPCQWATLSYFCLQNKAGKSTQWGESSQENVSKELSIINSLQMRRSLFANWISLHCRQKTTTSLWNKKGIGEKRNCGHGLTMHSVTRREGGCDVRKQWGGGRLLYINLYMSQGK